MHYLSKGSGIGALRLLALSSALLLAACGGGGTDSEPVAQAPAEQPVGAKRVPITADNQMEVAAQAGTAMSVMGPVAIMFAEFMVPPPPMNNLRQASATPKVAAPVNTPAAALVLSMRKFLPPKAPSTLQSAGSVTESETYDVECTSGSGTVTRSYTEDATSYSRKVVATLVNCQTSLGETSALINGKLDYSFVERFDPETETGSATADVLATNYSVKSGDFEVGMDGDMHLEADEDGYVTSGNRFSVTGLMETASGEEEVAETSTVQTITMIAFRQEITELDEGYTVTTEGTIETNQFGETAIYDISTTAALKYTYGEPNQYTAGQYKIVGAGNTTLIITADGTGTFKVQRDENGDGSIEATVEGVTASELYLNLGFLLA